jgi:hypothetical protein
MLKLTKPLIAASKATVGRPAQMAELIAVDVQDLDGWVMVVRVGGREVFRTPTEDDAGAIQEEIWARAMR